MTWPTPQMNVHTSEQLTWSLACAIVNIFTEAECVIGRLLKCQINLSQMNAAQTGIPGKRAQNDEDQSKGRMWDAKSTKAALFNLHNIWPNVVLDKPRAHPLQHKNLLQVTLIA